MLDPELASMVPPSIQVIRSGAVPIWLTRPFGVEGDIGLRGYFHLRSAIAKEINRTQPDVVFITGSPFYPMMLAGWIRKRWKVPVVLDFQDPWVSPVGEQAPRWSKRGISHRLAVALEPHAVRNAAFITSVSKLQNEAMVARYPWLDPTRMADIPIGGDPEDFEALRASMKHEPSETRRITFSYVGTAMPRSGPLLRTLFRGLAHLRANNPGCAKRLHLRFVGTSNQPNDSTTYRVRPLAEAEGVADLLTEEPARVPFLEALKVLAIADVVLMIGSDEPHYTASKIYPGLMSGRPFLSIFHRMSSSHDILIRAGGGLALAFETEHEMENLVPVIASGFDSLAANPDAFGHVDPKAYAPFTANAIAGQFADVFERAVHNSPQSVSPLCV